MTVRGLGPIKPTKVNGLLSPFRGPDGNIAETAHLYVGIDKGARMCAGKNNINKGTQMCVGINVGINKGGAQVCVVIYTKSALPTDHAVTRLYVTKPHYQNPPKACRSLATVTASVPICFIISLCLDIGWRAKCSSKAPSKIPFDNGLTRRSFLTVLHSPLHQLLSRLSGKGEAYLNARGLRPATC
jgi:hypothetical protein